MIEDHRPDHLGSSLRAGYLADGLVRVAAKLERGRQLDSGDLESVAQAKAFLDSAAQGPEVLKKSSLTSESLARAVALDAAAKAVSIASHSVAVPSADMEGVLAIVRKLVQLCVTVEQNREIPVEDLALLKAFFRALSRLSLERSAQYAWSSERGGSWPVPASIISVS